MKTRPMAAESFRADKLTDGQTDIIMQISRFRSFVKAPLKNLMNLFLG